MEWEWVVQALEALASVELDKPRRSHRSECSHSLFLRSSRKIRIHSNTKGIQGGGLQGTYDTLAVAAA